jgi:hypothetical protein
VSYNFSSYVFTFETEITGVTPINHASILVNLRTPKQIARLERRKSYRVEPAEGAPVSVRILPGNDELVTKARDISRHGASFLLPLGAGSFLPGTPLSLAIDLPKLGPVTVDAIVRSITESGVSGMAQYGVEYRPPVEFDSPLAQYVHWRKIEAHDAKNADAGTANKRVLVAIRESEQGTYAFICSSLALREICDFSAFTEIVSADVINFLEDGDSRTS